MNGLIAESHKIGSELPSKGSDSGNGGHFAGLWGFYNLPRRLLRSARTVAMSIILILISRCTSSYGCISFKDLRRNRSFWESRQNKTHILQFLHRHRVCFLQPLRGLLFKDRGSVCALVLFDLRDYDDRSKCRNRSRPSRTELFVFYYKAVSFIVFIFQVQFSILT